MPFNTINKTQSYLTTITTPYLTYYYHYQRPPATAAVSKIPVSGKGGGKDLEDRMRKRKEAMGFAERQVKTLVISEPLTYTF